MKTKPRKRINKSKEELLLDLKKNERFMEKMKFAKEQFFPALIESSKSVEDAQTFLSSLSSVIMEKFLARMKEVKMKDINLIEILDKKGDDYEAYSNLLGLFDDKDLFESKELIEGMKSEISLFVSEEMRTRTLDTLKVRWLDEI